MEAYPLQWPLGWPRTSRTRESRFGIRNNKPTIGNSRDTLLRELKMMGATEIVLSTNLELKGDGLPYSNQKNPSDRGVAVYFMWKKQAMSIACDTFDNIGCNIYAIAKTVAAMRSIDRYGCSELMNRAFTGFAALPAAGEKVVERPKTWFEILEVSEVASQNDITRAYREKAKETHPDLGGSTEEFLVIKNAYEKGMSFNK